MNEAGSGVEPAGLVVMSVKAAQYRVPLPPPPPQLKLALAGLVSEKSPVSVSAISLSEGAA